MKKREALSLRAFVHDGFYFIVKVGLIPLRQCLFYPVCRYLVTDFAQNGTFNIANYFVINQRHLIKTLPIVLITLSPMLSMLTLTLPAYPAHDIFIDYSRSWRYTYRTYVFYVFQAYVKI